MNVLLPTAAATFGYLSAVESPELGFFGGYLLVSPLGRPLEFHCTAPIRPSRALEILYGPTLQPYLLGEQIAGTLLAKARTKPQIILTDQPNALCHRVKIDSPIVCWQSSTGTDDALPTQPRQLVVAGHAFELPSGFDSDRDIALALLTQLASHVELLEPFDRIHEAIREAHRIDVRSPETQSDAA
ncbi:MAG: hypothetical protein AB7G28_10830 [Pirellulales bacterium]